MMRFTHLMWRDISPTIAEQSVGLANLTTRELPTHPSLPDECVLNTVSCQGAACLARALRANGTLKELDLRWNELGNEGARAIRDSLDTNRSLTTMKISGNKVRSR